MDTYYVDTKDGIRIWGIPISVKQGSDEYYAIMRPLVAELRASGAKEGQFPAAATGAAPMTPAAAATPGAAPSEPTTSGAPASAGDDINVAAVRRVDQMRPPILAEPGETTLTGVLAAANRGASPIAIGTALGAAAGAPFAGVGAIPGAAAGAGITAATFAAGDLMVPVINHILGTRYKTPTEAWGDLLTRVGVPEPDTAAERIVEAASRGAAAGIGDVGLGTTLAKSGSKVIQGIGKTIAAGPVSQVTGGASAAAAAQGAGEAGAGPVVQMAAGLAGGVLGSRLAPGDVTLTRPRAPKVQAAEDAGAEIGALVKKASRVRPGRAAARRRLVALAEINPEAKAAATRLGIELPADVFADNPQVRAAAGLTRSLAGSEPEAAWRAAVANAIDQADDVLKQYDATFIEGTAAPAIVSNRVRDVLTKTREAMNKEATALYAEVDQAVPKQTPVKLDKLKATLDEIASEVGEGGLTSQEKRLRAMAQTAQNQEMTYYHVVRGKWDKDDLLSLSAKYGEERAIRIFEKHWPDIEGSQLADYHVGGVHLYKTLAEAQEHRSGFGGQILKVTLDDFDDVRFDETEPGLPHYVVPGRIDKSKISIQPEMGEGMIDQAPTYGRLLREKNLIGQALARKESPYGNMEAGSLKRLYGALAEDQLANVDAARPGMGEQLRTANLIYAKERELGDRIVEVFGSDVEGSIANKMRSSIVSAGKGSGEPFDKLLDLVPEDLRRETVATSLASVARNRRGEFGFAEYANTYRGLRANPPVYAQIVKVMGEGSDQVLRDLYEVSRRITDARANVLVTGKANQALLQRMTAEAFIGKIFRATMIRTGAAAAGAALGGPVGAGVGSAVTDALSHGSRDGLKAAGKMFTSPEFQRLATAAAIGEMPGLDQVRAVARSSAFDQFARAVKLPIATDQRELWILAALQSGAGVKGEEQE